MNKIIKNTLILTAITVVSGLLLGIVYDVTKEPIAQAQERTKQKAFQTVLPEASEFTSSNFDEKEAAKILKENGYTDDITEVAEATDKKGKVIGYVINVTSHEGYGGDIEISVGIASDGTVKGIEMLSIGETAGLGMKAKDAEFKDQFRDKKVQKFTYTKNGEKGDDKIDAISGATITTNAVTNAVDSALIYYQTELGNRVSMNKCAERLYNGLVKENPTFVLMLGMCPTLAVTTSAINGIGMGLSTTAVLVMSNMLISMLRKVIPASVRMPAFIVVVASFVTIVDFLMAGFVPGLYKSLGLYIPLIVVNCIILGRAESYASKNPVLPSIFDGIGMGLGFTVGLTAIGIVRELLGAGEVFGIRVMPQSYEPLTIFVLAPGAFFVLACLVALQNKVKANLEKKGKKVPVSSGCGEGCSACASKGICGGHLAENEPHHEETNVKEEEEA